MGTMERVLLIDDDVDLCELVTELLSEEGFRVECRHHGARGLERAMSEPYALILLDLMLPGINGLDVLRRLRSGGNVTPVLMLTARGSDATDRIVGLEVGADDYLAKPFHPRELIARMRAILRRVSESARRPEVFLEGGVALDIGARGVRCDGAPVELTTVEFDLLALLIRRAGQVVTRDALAQAALGRSHSALDRSVDMHVSHLRRKLGPAGEAIKTVRSVGYQFAREGRL